MSQGSSTRGASARGPHVAVIMDGNGRWAAQRGLPRVAGHKAGAESVRRCVRAAPGLGIRTLTLYAFSADNWKRPKTEVAALFRLFHQYLRREAEELRDNGVRLRVIGRRDRLTASLRRAIEKAEDITSGGARLDLRVAIDYSARQAIVAAAQRMKEMRTGADAEHEFARLLGDVTHWDRPTPDVDLLIRTSGEKRLSDFLLWEAAYAEMYFTDRFWPEFGGEDLRAALEAFSDRDRRFGGLSAAAS
ncbi:MAG TPA: polyprenyl diphosphate synthase [Longimicrobiales bacterium]|nr:polyprenyl diphosphate synthase [Longimicrobiales bacterium]